MTYIEMISGKSNGMAVSKGANVKALHALLRDCIHHRDTGKDGAYVAIPPIGCQFVMISACRETNNDIKGFRMDDKQTDSSLLTHQQGLSWGGAKAHHRRIRIDCPAPALSKE